MPGFRSLSFIVSVFHSRQAGTVVRRRPPDRPMRMFRNEPALPRRGSLHRCGHLRDRGNSSNSLTSEKHRSGDNTGAMARQCCANRQSAHRNGAAQAARPRGTTASPDEHRSRADGARAAMPGALIPDRAFRDAAAAREVPARCPAGCGMVPARTMAPVRFHDHGRRRPCHGPDRKSNINRRLRDSIGTRHTGRGLPQRPGCPDTALNWCAGTGGHAAA